MSSRSEDNIVIKLEIHIPPAGGSPTVSLDQSKAERVGTPHESEVIFEPVQNYPTMTRTNGEICLRGRRNNPAATEVWAKIFPGAPTFSSPLATLPPGAVPCTMDAAGNFMNAALGGVTGYPYPMSHRVIAWEKGPYNMYFQNDSKDFIPLWGPYTECDYPHTLSNRTVTLGQSPLKFEMLPVRWTFVTKSFAGKGVSALNGTWTVSLRTAPNQKILYCNGGNGTSTPRVQLVCESPFAETWQLRFEINNSRVIYSLPASQFNPQQQNRFSHAQIEVCDEDSAIPSSVVIRPV